MPVNSSVFADGLCFHGRGVLIQTVTTGFCGCSQDSGIPSAVKKSVQTSGRLLHCCSPHLCPTAPKWAVPHACRGLTTGADRLEAFTPVGIRFTSVDWLARALRSRALRSLACSSFNLDEGEGKRRRKKKGPPSPDCTLCPSSPSSPCQGLLGIAKY